MRSGWSRAWAAWGIAFAVIEARSLKVEHASLSEHTRTIFGFDNTGPFLRLRRAGFLGFWVWFGLHITRGTSGCVSRITSPTPSA